MKYPLPPPLPEPPSPNPPLHGPPFPLPDPPIGGGGPARLVEEKEDKEELMTSPTPQGTSHCSCLEHCFLFSRCVNFVSGNRVQFVTDCDRCSTIFLGRCSMGVKPDTGTLQFNLFKSTHVVNAYKCAKEILVSRTSLFVLQKRRREPCFAVIWIPKLRLFLRS